jgi:bifunctional DNase/RNase
MQVVEKQQQAQGKQWQLLRAAIVDLANDTFIGRIFFGNPETGEVVWDCDCRPSDAFWLSLQVRMCSWLAGRLGMCAG